MKRIVLAGAILAKSIVMAYAGSPTAAWQVSTSTPQPYGHGTGVEFYISATNPDDRAVARVDFKCTAFDKNNDPVKDADFTKEYVLPGKEAYFKAQMEGVDSSQKIGCAVTAVSGSVKDDATATLRSSFKGVDLEQQPKIVTRRATGIGLVIKNTTGILVSSAHVQCTALKDGRVIEVQPIPVSNIEAGGTAYEQAVFSTGATDIDYRCRIDRVE